MEEVEGQLIPKEEDHRIVDIDYCNNASAIYQMEPIDDIVIREWGPDGKLQEATLLVGRLAKGAFTQKAAEIPLLKEKLDWLLAQSGALPKSYAHREIKNIFNRFPVRELFYANVRALKEIIDRIVYMTGDDEIAVHVRKGAGYQALPVAFSRLRYSYKIEEDLRQALSDRFGPTSFTTSADLGAVSLLIYYFDEKQLEHPVEAEAARALAEGLVSTWEDRVARALENAFGEREGRRLFERYVRYESRSGLYRESTPPEEVPEDVRRLESLESQLEVRLVPRTADTCTLKLFAVRELSLTETLRTLNNLGLVVTDDLRVPLRLPDGRKGFLFRLDLEATTARIGALVSGEERFVEALRALDEGRATDDPLNGLILLAGLTWRQVEVLRTLRNHLLQVRPHYNVETVNGVLLRNSGVAGGLLKLFAARFDPGLSGNREAWVEEAEASVRAALEAVKSLAEDEVLRALDNLVRSALRTNVFQRPERPVFSIKVDSRKVEGMPSPRPMFEIYVHSRLLEGIHLRGGKVARGGIRWSDRHDDFRTEILGLMKTQMVKNAIIVPVGSKGGFVLKGSVPPRPALDAYLIDRYREFISGLLDLTDNIVDGQVLHPPEVVRYDGDDPYLVVAADKGTAHLSDTANSVSAQYGFWLGDAFASGGSAGYDHKKMGITARGAWECVKHHFRNLGLDIQKEPFTATGIGDMSGDVFGNGVLLSRTLKLQAAFNHAHIFVDPDPDPEASFKERERLFKLPRSELARLQRRPDQQGRRDLRPLGQGHPALARDARPARPAAGQRLRRGGDPPDPLRQGRPALQRRHRHLREGLQRGRRRRGRPRQRPRARGRQPGAGAGGGGGRQPGLHPARAAGVLGSRGRHQHRRGRQLGRRGHLGPRGQHQDPHEPPHQEGRGEGPRGAQPHPGRDDGGGGGAGAGRQREPGARPHPGRPAQRGALRGLRGPGGGHGGRRRPQPRRRRHPHP